MVTRSSLGVLAGLTLALFAAAALLGNHHHGVRQVAADISWNGFLLCLLFLLVASVFVLVRSRARVRAAGERG